MSIKKKLKKLFDDIPEEHLTVVLLVLAAIIVIVALTGKKTHKAVLMVYLVI